MMRRTHVSGPIAEILLGSSHENMPDGALINRAEAGIGTRAAGDCEIQEQGGLKLYDGLKTSSAQITFIK